jgi:MoaA/NifB/PqqE/SkfB family radical SAM enzyme
MKLSNAFSYTKAGLGILSGTKAFGGPVMGSISLTTRCNIRCIHCYYHSPVAQAPNFPPVRNARLNALPLPGAEEIRNFEGVDVDPAVVRRLIDQFLAMGTRRIQLSGFGETFLHPEIMDCIERVKHAGSFCLANSNGTLLTKEIIDRLVAVGFDEIRVTTMAGTTEGYVATHPGSTARTFERLRASLEYLREAKASRGSAAPRLDLVCIVVAQNLRGLREFADFARDVGADRITFRPFNDVFDPGLASLLPSEEEVSLVRRELARLKVELDARSISNNIGTFLHVFARRLDTSALYRLIPCYQGWVSAYVNPFGDVAPCCGCSTPLGNINETDFRSIWNSRAYAVFRQFALNLPRTGVQPQGCDCGHCAHAALNLKVFRALHPLKGRDAFIDAAMRSGCAYGEAE